MTTITESNGKVNAIVEESPLEKSRRTLSELREKIAAEQRRQTEEKARKEREESEEFLRQRLQEAARHRASISEELTVNAGLLEEMTATWREARQLGLHDEPEVEAISSEIASLREQQDQLRKELSAAIASHEDAKKKLEQVIKVKRPAPAPTVPLSKSVPATQSAQRSGGRVNWEKTDAQMAIEQASTATLELVLALCTEATLPRHLAGISEYIASLPQEERRLAEQARSVATERISALYHARQRVQASSNPCSTPAAPLSLNEQEAIVVKRLGSLKETLRSISSVEVIEVAEAARTALRRGQIEEARRLAERAINRANQLKNEQDAAEERQKREERKLASQRNSSSKDDKGKKGKNDKKKSRK